MAVPKKRTSKKKTRMRLANWKAKGRKMASRALTLAKSVLNKDSKFIFDPKKEKLEEENLKKEDNDNLVVDDQNENDKKENDVIK